MKNTFQGRLLLIFASFLIVVSASAFAIADNLTVHAQREALFTRTTCRQVGVTLGQQSGLPLESGRCNQSDG